MAVALTVHDECIGGKWGYLGTIDGLNLYRHYPTLAYIAVGPDEPGVAYVSSSQKFAAYAETRDGAMRKYRERKIERQLTSSARSRGFRE